MSSNLQQPYNYLDVEAAPPTTPGYPVSLSVPTPEPPTSKPVEAVFAALLLPAARLMSQKCRVVMFRSARIHESEWAHLVIPKVAPNP
jgi:hypothetical protein